MFKYKYLIFLLLSHSLCALTTLQVTVSTDNNPGDMGDAGDLRYCLNTMNQELNSSPDDSYEIVFDTPMTIQLNGILPIINNSANPVNITIGNSGLTPTVTIDGQNIYPGFFIPMGNVTIQNMIFQNCIAQGGRGGDGISGGGGGLGAGGAIYAPQSFLNGSNPSITLINVLIYDCSAVGGDGGSFFTVVSPTGDEGGGGGGGFAGAGGSVVTTGSTGGGGGGGFGGNGGDVTVSIDNPSGGGGGGSGGGGIGSRAVLGTPTNLGHGGSDQTNGQDGNGYGLLDPAGSGAGGYTGGNDAGGGGGGGAITPGLFGGGGGGSSGGGNGMQPTGITPPGGSATPSGGNGADGGGGGGAGVVTTASSNSIDGAAGAGGYGGGGGGGAGTGAYDSDYTVEGGFGGVGGGGGGGGVNSFGTTPATGGNSTAGGGGGGGGPSNNSTALGGTDVGNLGGGAGGTGANTVGLNSGGGGGGGGSGLGGAIFVDSNLNFTIQALAGIPTVFTTTNCTTQAGIGGIGRQPDATSGLDGSALGNSIFLRSGSSLTLIALQSDDVLTLGEQVSFVDDTSFGGQGTSVNVRGDGTVVYNGTTDYQGAISINNANLKVNGTISQATINVCRNSSFSLQRGTLSGIGTLTGSVFANSGAIWPETGESLTLGSLQLSPAAGQMLGSLVHIEIDSSGTSLVSVTGSAQLAGVLEIVIDQNAQPGLYTILTSSGITGTFDTVSFTGEIPNYSLSYLPVGSPTYIQFNFLGFLQAASSFQGVGKKNNFGFQYELYNQLTWAASSSSQVTGYYIYRDEVKIATVSSATLSYQDHNRPAGTSCVYWLVAFDSDGNVSSPVTVTVSSL